MDSQSSSFLDMWSLWDLHGFISASQSRPLFEKLQQVRQADRNENLQELINCFSNKKEDEIVRVYALKAHTIQAKADNKTAEKIIGLLNESQNSLYLRIACAETLSTIKSKETLEPLLMSLLYSNQPQLKVIIASAIKNHSKAQWEEKLALFLSMVESKTLYWELIDIEAVFEAVRPPIECLQNNRSAFSDHLFSKFPKLKNGLVFEVLVTLLLESVGRNQFRAEEKIYEALRTRKINKRVFENILNELNRSLTKEELEKKFNKSFKNPLREINKNIIKIWEDAIKSTEKTISNRLKNSTVLLWAGIIVLAGAIFWFIISQNLGEVVIGIFLSLFLISISYFYRGSIQNTKDLLTEISIANTAYTAYWQRSLIITNTFSTQFLKNKPLSLRDVDQTNQLIKEAMEDSINALQHRRSSMIDEFLNELER